MRRKRNMTWVAIAFAWVFVFGACNSVLGIEDAQLDPLLLDAGSGGSSGAAGSGGTAGAGDAAPDGPLSLCEEYCNTVQAACSDEFAVYDSLFTCVKECAYLPPGLTNDDGVNTIECRLKHAKLALSLPGERGVECPAAGPGGNGVCGSNCDGYCALVQAICVEPSDKQFGSVGECLIACQSVPDLGGYNISIISGNSVQCRLYHLSAAQAGGALLHCPHTGGQPPCAAPPDAGSDAATDATASDSAADAPSDATQD